jgi:alkylation response protein AidB-like acyl-CoA dehydrogenase
VASLVLFRMSEMLPTTHGDALARPPDGVLNRAQMGQNWVLSNHLWVYFFSTGTAISTYGRASRTYTIFEGNSEIQRLIISRAISGVHIK